MEPKLDKDLWEKGHNFGLIPEDEITIEQLQSDPFLGGGFNIINESGDWGDYLPQHERQHGTYYDTAACTNFAFLNNLEILIKYKYAVEINYSDRFNAKTSGTDPNIGNYSMNAPKAAMEHGLVLEDVWPFDRGRDVPQEQKYVDWYYQDIPENALNLGKKWLNEWDLKWCWGATGRVHNGQLKEMLKIGPVSVSIPTGARIENGVYQYVDRPYNHKVVLVKINEDGTRDLLDHYMRIRRVSADYKIGWPMLLNINKRMKRLIKGDQSSEVYMVGDNNRLSHIYNEGVFNKGRDMGLWGSWDAIDELPQDEVDAMEKDNSIMFSI